ncbi:uncharacterized protein LOC144862999 isoform X1 [Branchiostoma floridae x Branchiostoma japonicum]
MPRCKSKSVEQRRKLIAQYNSRQREGETPDAAAKRRESNRVGMKRHRSQESAETTEKRRAADKSHKKQCREQETAETTAKRRAADKSHKKQRREQETAETTAKRRAADKSHKKQRREQETAETTAKRRAADKSHKKQRREQETAETTAERRSANRVGMKRHRAQESAETTAKRRAADKSHKKQRREQESAETTAERRAADKSHKKRQRKQETAETTAKRLKTARTVIKRCRRKKQSEEATIDKCASTFFSRIAEGPIYACMSCCRLLYRSTIREFKVENYTTNEDTEKIVHCTTGTQVNGKYWVCMTCHNALKQGRVPTQSWGNNLELDEVPPQLKDLRPLELRLISQRIPFMKLVGLPRGGQKAIHGSAVNVPTKLQTITSLLPRLPATAEVVPLKLKRRLCYQGHYMYEYIRPKKVVDALVWLKNNNPLYKDITICPDWEQEWEGDDPDLWEAMTGRITENKDREATLSPREDGPVTGNDNHGEPALETERGEIDLKEEEDRISFEQASQLRGLPYDTMLQEERVADGECTYSLAPGENQKPCPFLTDEKFEEMANPSKYPFGRGGLLQERSTNITPRKYFNQRLLHQDGRFARDIEYLLTAQYTVEAKQVRDSIQISMRQTRGHTFRNKTINAGLMKNSDNVQAMLRTDMAFKFMRNIRGSPAYWNTVLLDLLAMVRQLGIPTWFLTLSAADMQWPEVIQSIAHQYGKRLTAEDIKNMPWEEKCSWLRYNPVTAARQFNHRLNVFFKEFIGGKANPIGELQDFMIRIEFQARGSPHAHTILWMKDAPKLNVNSDKEVIAFINKHQTCAIPDEEDSELRNLVLSLQRHVHSATCRKGGICRFKSPHQPSKETVIARPDQEELSDVKKKQKEVLSKVRSVMDDKNLPEDISLQNLLQKADVSPDAYEQALKVAKSEKIILQRHPSERNINQYNPKILTTWRANMDLQFILDPYSCIMYITSYMLKSERAMSELLRKVAEESRGEDLKAKLTKVGSAFLNNRELSAQEAAWKQTSLPLHRASRARVFVNTAPKEKRVSMLKPQSVLQDMADEDDNIFCTSLTDRYETRPNILKDMSLIEFAATYKTGGQDAPDEVFDHIPEVRHSCDDQDATCSGETDEEDSKRYPPVITLLNDMGQMRKRKRHCIVRFHKEKNEGEERYRNLLMLYYPWRNEDVDLKAHFSSFKEHYDCVKDTVHANEAKFSVHAEAIEEAYDNLQRNGPPEDAWDSIAPNVEFQQAEQQAEGTTIENELHEENDRDNIDLAPHTKPSGHSELYMRFSTELNTTSLTSSTYRSMMRSLNTAQMEVVRFHRKWCKDAIYALQHDQPVPQYTLFLSGPGGVGKSHVIKLIHHDTIRLVQRLSGHFDPDELSVLITAFTGTAAFNIDGMTLHSALGFGGGPKKDKEYRPLGSEKLHNLRLRLGKLKLLIVDEVSMLGSDHLYHTHRRLEDICGTCDPDSRFGGVSILAVGDLFQLQPVGQRHVFDLPSDSYAKLHGSLWEENFSMMELTECVRQREDQQFAQLLLRMRTAKCTEGDIAVLKSRIISKTDPNYPSEVLHVFKTNKEVDDHNKEHLKKLSTQHFHIQAIDTKKDIYTGLVDVGLYKTKNDKGLRETVSLAVGARVMVTVNIDVADGLVNGTLGKVVGIDNTLNDVHAVLVTFDSDRVGRQAKADSQYKDSYPGAVPIKRQSLQILTGSTQTVQAQRAQFPLTLAWGCTIHKVQGKTLDRIVVSMDDKSNFMPGQCYVAMSRVKTLNGLYLLGFDPKSIRCNPDVVQEMNRLRQKLSPKVPLPFATTMSGMQIRLLNIRSYLEHLDDLKVDQTVPQADVLCIVETFLKGQEPIDIVLPNAQSFRADRVGRLGGGVMAVARKAVCPTELAITSSELECTAITVTKSSTKVNIVTIYRPPCFPPAIFMDRLQNILPLLQNPTVILGDFNFDLLKYPDHNILTVMNQFGFKQQVQTPTTDQGSLLDHVYINSNCSAQVNVVDTYYSDHDMVCISLNCKDHADDTP